MTNVETGPGGEPGEVVWPPDWETEQAYMDDLAAQQDQRTAAEAAAAEHEARVSRELANLRARAEAARRMRQEGRPAIPPGYVLTDLLDLPIPPVQYRVQDCWPAGSRLLIAAQAKAGKTTVRDNLVRSLADGSPFLDRWDTHPINGRVGIVDTELEQGMIQRWLRDQAITQQRRVWVQPLRGYVGTFDLLDDDCRAHWVARLQEQRVSILIVDCIGPILAQFGLKENENTDVGRWLLAFEQLVTEAGIKDAALIHHFGHLREAARGATRLQDWPDVLWSLTMTEARPGEERDGTRFFAARGRDVAIKEGTLKYDDLDRHLTYTTGSRAKARQASDVRELVAFLRDHPRQEDGKPWAKTKLAESPSHDIPQKRAHAAIELAAAAGELHLHETTPRSKNVTLPDDCPDCGKSGSVWQDTLPEPP